MVDGTFHECSSCRRRKATKQYLLRIMHDGLEVRLLKEFSSCRQCVVNAFKRRFVKYQHLIAYSGGAIGLIAWKGFAAEYQEADSTVAILFLDLGILSASADGNWEVVSKANLPLNPMVGNDYIYFKDPTHATAYIKELTVPDQDGWSIRRIGITYTKEELKKLGYF